MAITCLHGAAAMAVFITQKKMKGQQNYKKN